MGFWEDLSRIIEGKDLQGVMKRESLSQGKDDNKAKRPGHFTEGLKRNQCCKYLKKRIVRMGVRHEGACKEERQEQEKMVKVPNFVGFGLKFGFSCFLFACLLVLMRQCSIVTKSMDSRVRQLGFKPELCHFPAEGP